MPAGLSFTKVDGKLGLGMDPIAAMRWLFGMYGKDKQVERQNKQLAQINPVLEPGKRGEEDLFSWEIPGDYS